MGGIAYYLEQSDPQAVYYLMVQGHACVPARAVPAMTGWSD